jgi:hypothetical protein
MVVKATRVKDSLHRVGRETREAKDALGTKVRPPGWEQVPCRHTRSPAEPRTTQAVICKSIYMVPWTTGGLPSSPAMPPPTHPPALVRPGPQVASHRHFSRALLLLPKTVPRPRHRHVTPVASGLHGAPRISSLWSVLGQSSRSAAHFDRILTETFQLEGATEGGHACTSPVIPYLSLRRSSRIRHVRFSSRCSLAEWDEDMLHALTRSSHIAYAYERPKVWWHTRYKGCHTHTQSYMLSLNINIPLSLSSFARPTPSRVPMHVVAMWRIIISHNACTICTKSHMLT